MRKLLPAFALVLSVSSLAESPWLTGKLISYEQERAPRIIDGSDYGSIVYDLQIDTGDKVLFGEDVLRRKGKTPQLTENNPIQYKIDGNKLEFQDATGKTFKVVLTKQRMKGLQQP